MNAANVLTQALKMLQDDLKGLGLQAESTTTHRVVDPEYWAGVHLQKSRGNSRDWASFTVNVQVIKRTDWDTYRARQLAAGRNAPERPNPCLDYGVGTSRRAGHVMPQQQDHWWNVTPSTNPKVLAASVAEDLTKHVLPYMYDLMSKRA